MAKVRYRDKIIEVENGTLLVDAIRDMEEKIETPCNCIGMCKKCIVRVKGRLSKRDSAEDLLDEDQRLACITKVLGDVEVLGKAKDILEIVEKDEQLNIKADKKGRVLAIDVGTTGVSARLIDLEKGRVVYKYSNLNYQSEYGADVLSRITYCIKNGIENLQNAIINQIKDIINEAGQVDKVAISGNPTMLHLIYGENPKSIAVSPYKAVFLEGKNMVIEGVSCDLLPSASSYIGADIVSGVSAVNLEERNNSLFIDIGTNGEIVLSIDGRLYGTSAAAGPAFEGMNIECGSRAKKGSIEGFEIKEEDFVLKTIGNEKASGICGSGLMDIMWELVKNKIVLKSGKFNSKMDPIFKEKFKDKKFYITEDVYITQKDIRQIQLAKGAIATGIKLLLETVGKEITDINEVIIAGSFGSKLNPDSILGIGIIPKCNGVVSFEGNTSLRGSIGYLIDDDMNAKIQNTEINVVELSKHDKFQDVFIKELQF